MPFLHSCGRLTPVLAGKAGSVGRLSWNFVKFKDLGFSSRLTNSYSH
jgi:hypothetical protein